MKRIKNGFVIGGLFLLLAGGGLGVAHLTGGPKPGQLKVELRAKPTVMTVAYKAYGNAEAGGGKYWLGKLVMENTGGDSLQNLTVSYRIPDYVDWTTPDTAAEILPGQTAVLPIYPRFPRSVTGIRTRTPAQLEVKIAYEAGGKEHSSVEKRPFEFRGVTEIEYTSIEKDEILGWFDMWDNSEVLAAYMTDEDEVVKAYFGKISETMGGTPYVKSAEDLGKLLGAIYKFQVGTGMVYMGAKGVPETLGDTRTLVQSIKLPREVIRGNSGTCIELTLLMSALLNQCGVKSQMVLIPGHAFPVVELPNGQLLPFETTGIGGQNLGGVSSFEEALAKGEAHWKNCMEGKQPFVMVDYAAHQGNGMRPPELEPVDITALSQLLASRIPTRTEVPVQQTQPQPQQQVVQVNHQIQVAPQPNVVINQTPNVPTPGPRSMPTQNVSVYRDPTGTLLFQYPTHWFSNSAQLSIVQQSGAPWYLFNAEDQVTGWSVAAFGFGTPDKEACVEALEELGFALGLSMSFGQPRQQMINGTNWTVVPLWYENMTGVAYTAEFYLFTVGQQTYGVGLCGPTHTGNAALSTVNEILYSIQVGA